LIYLPRASRTAAPEQVAEAAPPPAGSETIWVVTDFNPSTSTSLQLFTQALTPIASAGNNPEVFAGFRRVRNQILALRGWGGPL